MKEMAEVFIEDIAECQEHHHPNSKDVDEEEATIHPTKYHPPTTIHPTEYHHPKQSSLDEYLSSENTTSIWGSNFRFLFNIIWFGVPPNSESWHPQTGWEWLINQPGQNVIKHLFVCDLRIFELGKAKAC
jgi:hypothetical protein